MTQPSTRSCRYGVSIVMLRCTNGVCAYIAINHGCQIPHRWEKYLCTYTTDLISLSAKVDRCVGLGLGVYDFRLLDPGVRVTFTLLGVFELE